MAGQDNDSEVMLAHFLLADISDLNPEMNKINKNTFIADSAASGHMGFLDEGMFDTVLCDDQIHVGNKKRKLKLKMRKIMMNGKMMKQKSIASKRKIKQKKIHQYRKKNFEVNDDNKSEVYAANEKVNSAENKQSKEKADIGNEPGNSVAEIKSDANNRYDVVFMRIKVKRFHHI